MTVNEKGVLAHSCATVAHLPTCRALPLARATNRRDSFAGRGGIACGRQMSSGFSSPNSLACKAEPPTIQANENPMKILILVYALSMTISLSLQASTPAQEKAFADKYKTAFEAKDTATLESFFYTEGSDPAVLQFLKMTLSSIVGEKISKIELVDLTPEDAKKLAAPTDSPTGGKVCLNLKPTKKLVVTTEKKDPSGPTSSFVNVVSEKDGKLVIPIPGPCK